MVIGIDEVGRGALAGDVVAVALYFINNKVKDLKDSKKLSAKQRLDKFAIIKNNCHYAIGVATNIEIDNINILNATMLAMKRAFDNLHICHNKYRVFVDGNKCPDIRQSTCVIGGDTKITEIAAASIIAKVTRDRMMLELHKKYQQYGFHKHKGYATKEHIEQIKKIGILQQHRKSFAPIKHYKLLKNYQ